MSHLKPLDLVIALAAAALVAATAAYAYSPGKAQLSAVIKGPSGEWVYPLSADRQVAVPGPLGDTLIAIKDRSLRILDSPCPNKTCIAAGSIDRPGQWLACLPNDVVVHIEGGGEDAGVDATVY